MQSNEPMRLVADIETNGLLRQDSPIIHCLVTQDLDTGQVICYDDEGSDNEPIVTGIKYLMEAEEVWGHNFLSFDTEFIREIYPFFKPKKIYDTLILSRLFFTDLLDRDFRSKPANMPANLYGRASLESWGYRLGHYKSEFGKTTDWSEYSAEMLAYCIQDVAVNVELCKLFEPKLEQYKACIETEHRLAEVMAWQEREGWDFDVRKAHELESKLRSELELLSEQMRDTFHMVDGGQFTPKRPNQNKGYVEGATMTRLKEFNPTSRQHIAFAFQNFRGWKPRELTDTGRPKIDEKILMEIGTDESKKFARILTLQKHLGQLSEGQNSWLKLAVKGKVHHSCVLNTNTGRQIHMRPNVAQTPSEREYRELWGPGKGRVQVGADASSLELRCLGHYLALFDGGSFSKEVVEGDIHSKLAAIYQTSRKISKGVTYAMIYGGSNFRIGLTAGASKQDAAKEGKRIRSAIMSGLDGFAELSKAIATRAETGVLKALDGRPIRLGNKTYAATNYLLQSCGACLCKAYVLRSHELLKEAQIDYRPLGFIHDEQQLSVHPDHAEQAAFLLVAAMKDVQKQFNFRCELDAESVIGQSWADCH